MTPPPAVLPHGVLDLATSYANRFAAAAGVVLGQDEVATLLWHPHLVEQPAAPPAPVPCGDGALCVDLGPDDHDAWARCVASISDDGLATSDPEVVAAEAQLWGLPVTPYRLPSPSGPASSSPTDSLASSSTPVQTTSSGRPLDGLLVVDFTTMWAGPLSTALLAAAGATVLKVEPLCRSDGLRFGDGDEGLGRAPHFVALNSGKVPAVWDLREPGPRSSCIDLIGRADLVVESFSPRVLPNLGLDPEELLASNRRLRMLSLTAFEHGSREAQWRTYGPGVHATLGLGWRDGTHRAPSLSYPDPLGGLLAAARVAEAVASEGPRRLRVSLAEAVRPLVGCHPAVESPEVPPAVLSTPVCDMGARV